MASYRVEIVIQAPGGEPVTMAYLREGPAISAITAVTSVIEQFERETEVPSAVAPALLSITVTKES